MIKECRGASSRLESVLRPLPLPRPSGRGCFAGVSSAAEGAGVPLDLAKLRRSRSRSQRRVQPPCTRPAAAILNCSVVCGASARPQAAVSGKPFRSRNADLKCRVEVFVHGVVCESEARRDTKKKKKKVRLYFITQILFLFLGNFEWALLLTKLFSRETVPF